MIHNDQEMTAAAAASPDAQRRTLGQPSPSGALTQHAQQQQQQQALAQMHTPTPKPPGLDTPPSQTHRIQHCSSTSSASTQISSPSTATTRSLSSTVPPSPDLLSLQCHLAQPTHQSQPPPQQQHASPSPEKRMVPVHPMGPPMPLLASPALLSFRNLPLKPPQSQPRVTSMPPSALGVLAAAAASPHNHTRPRSLPSSPGHPVLHMEASNMPSSRVYVGNVTFATKADELQQFFFNALGVTGEVQIITYPGGKSKGCAIVEFPSIADAVRAINEMQNKKLHGRTVFIREDREEKGFGGPNGVAAAGAAAATAAGAAGSSGFIDHSPHMHHHQQHQQHYQQQNMWGAAAGYSPSSSGAAAAAQYNSSSPPPPLTMTAFQQHLAGIGSMYQQPQQQPQQQHPDVYAAAMAAFQQQQQQQHQNLLLQQQLLDQSVQQQAALAEQQALEQRRRLEQAYAWIPLIQNARDQHQIMAFLAATQQSQAAAASAAAAAGYPSMPTSPMPASPYAASAAPSSYPFNYSPTASPSPSLSQSMDLRWASSASQASSRSPSISNSHYHAAAAAAASAANASAAAGFPSYPNNAQPNLYLQPTSNGHAASAGAGAGVGTHRPMQIQIPMPHSQMGIMPRVVPRVSRGINIHCSQLYFTNLPYSLNQSALVSLCASQGPLEFVRLITDERGHSRGCANVKFVHRSDALRAISQTNHTQALHGRLLDTRYINVRMDDGAVQMPQHHA